MPPVFRGIKVHLHADRLHVSEQELDTDMEHAKIHVWAAVAARACASMQRARYLWLAPSTDSDSCSHLFCLRRLKRHQGPISLPFAEKSLTTEKRRVCTHHFTLYPIRGGVHTFLHSVHTGDQLTL